MRKIVFFTLALTSILISCNPNDEQSTIVLLTSGYEDSTKIYLDNFETSTTDSGFIINNRLVFVAEADEPTQYTIRPVFKSREGYQVRTIWKESRQLTIHASEGDLKNAVVEGSEIQKFADKVAAEKASLKKVNDSLVNIYRSLEDKTGNEALALREKGREITQAMAAVETNFVKNNPNQLYSAILLKQLMTYTIPKDETQALYENLSSEMQTSRYGLTIKKYLNLSRDLEVGDQAIDFQLPDLDGNLIGLHDFKGKYILLDFCSSGCGPCRMENPKLLKYYESHKDKGFEIISISFDKNRERWAKAVAQDSMIWTTLCDFQGTDGDAIMTYNVFLMPTYFLIDPNQKIIAKMMGAGKLDEELTKIF